MADVFFSYRNAPDRRVIVQRLATILRAYGVTVWWDYGLDAGESYRAQIMTELTGARIVAPLWCAESVESPWVRMEAELGRDKLLPARLQKVEPPNSFEAIQAADLTGWDGDVRSPRLQDLVRRVCERLGRPATAPTDSIEVLAELPPLKPLPETARKRPGKAATDAPHAEANWAGIYVQWISAAAVATLLVVLAYLLGARDRGGELATMIEHKQLTLLWQGERARAEAATKKAEHETQRADAAAGEAQAAQAEVKRLALALQVERKRADEARKQIDEGAQAKRAAEQALEAERKRVDEATKRLDGQTQARRAAEGALEAERKRADSAMKKADEAQAQIARLTQSKASDALGGGLLSTMRDAAPLTAEEERALKPEDSFKECPGCPEMVVLPAGELMMGSPPGEVGRPKDESPQRKVRIDSPFAVGRFEVTFAEWEACVTDGGCWSNRSPGDQGWGKGRRPVINVSWHDAKEYVAWLSRKTRKTYRLLSEAEWEYAARARTTTAYAVGDAITKSHAQYLVDRTAEVGSFPANAFGLHDMHGNVWEWVEDSWHPDYKGAPPGGSVWQGGDLSHRVLRGGAWGSKADDLRSANRARSGPSIRSDNFGFRIARTL